MAATELDATGEIGAVDSPSMQGGEPVAPERASVRDRLVPPMPGSALLGWLGPLAVAVIGGLLRFDRLQRPHGVIFDETYYAKEGLSFLKFGVEHQAVEGADTLLLAGNTNVFKPCVPDAGACASYVVHPPFGKWMIALGEHFFGANPLGWRVAAALVGTVSIFLLARLARRMTRSTLLGSLAGLLLALDGLHFVLSRFALLDVYLTFWIIAGFACLLVDRDRARSRLADWVESTDRFTDMGPSLGIRPWRLLAALCLGLACSVKWSGIFFLVAFFFLSFAWDMGARRAAGLRRPYGGALVYDLFPSAAGWAVVSAVAYVATWSGWFASSTGWGRRWDEATGEGALHFVLNSAASWFNYQRQMLGFHRGLTTDHPYMSEPWEWPVLAKPVAFFYTEPKLGQKGCMVEHCAREVLGIGTPAIWWVGIIALIVLLAWYVAVRDWRAGAVLLGYAVGWVPWFILAIFSDRTMFLFYALPMLPFLILAIVLALGLLLGPGGQPTIRRAVGAAIAGCYTLVVIANFWWFWPILTGRVIPHAEWYTRMLFQRWI